MKEKFDVTGMTCSACSSRVEKCVSKLDGVEQVSVNLLTNSMQVEYKEDMLGPDGIIHAVEAAGYGARVQGAASVKSKSREPETNVMEEQLKNMKMRLIVSFAFLIPLMYVSMGHMVNLPLPGFLSGTENAVSFALTQFLLCLPVVYVNRAYYEKGYSTLFHGAPNMDSLIAIGSTAALVYGIFAIYRMSYGLGTGNMALVHQYHMDLYFESAAMILALITVGKYMETRSKGKTSEAITKLLDLAPKTAIVERGGVQTEIPVEEVMVGETVILKPGQSVPVDGVILDGTTSIDESAITGESIPVQKQTGDSVIAATINKTGSVRFQATKVGDDTTFSQIVRLVEEASSSKAPIAKMADKIAGVFVPVVMVIALATVIIWLLTGATFEFALSSGICVLVISCPCALGLATPVAIMVGTGKGAEQGILIKSGEALETAHNIDTVVLDKTGTITEGKPQVTDILVYGKSETEFLQIAGALERGSEHPLAEAVLEYVKEKQIADIQAEEFDSIPGKGVKARIGGMIYYAGNEKLMAEMGVSLGDQEETVAALAGQGKTPLLFADEKALLGIVAVADVVKATSREAIQKFREMGIQVIMMTGDNRRTANAIKDQIGIDTVIAEVLPQEKEAHVAELKEQGRHVAMIGDGVNDAPALVRADVGLAIGAGTDVAIESADIVLMRNDLLDAVTAIRLSKKVIRNIKENLFWAFFYNSVGIPLAAGVFYNWLGWKLNPMFGAAAMSLSSFCVVTNALRLKFFKSDREAVQAASSDIDRREPVIPSIREEITAEESENKEEKNMITLKVEGMMCGHCQAHVEKALNGIEGVQATVDLEKKEAYVNCPDSVSADTLIHAVKEAGYEATVA